MVSASLGGRMFAFYVVYASLGGRMYAFLRGIRKSRWQTVCIFMSYPQVWVAECMHFYVVSASLGGRMYAFLRGIRNQRTRTPINK